MFQIDGVKKQRNGNLSLIPLIIARSVKMTIIEASFVKIDPLQSLIVAIDTPHAV